MDHNIASKVTFTNSCQGIEQLTVIFLSIYIATIKRYKYWCRNKAQITLSILFWYASNYVIIIQSYFLSLIMLLKLHSTHLVRVDA